MWIAQIRLGPAKQSGCFKFRFSGKDAGSEATDGTVDPEAHRQGLNRREHLQRTCDAREVHVQTRRREASGVPREKSDDIDKE